MLKRLVRSRLPRPRRRVPVAARFALAAALLALLIPASGALWRGLAGVLPLPAPLQAPSGAPPPAARFTVRARAVDGDTLAAGGERLRLHGIDAPEAGQPCEGGGRTYDCGAEATAAMARLLGRGPISCEQLDTDRHGRRIVRCRDAHGANIGAELVWQGWAVAFRRYALDDLPEEAAARLAGRGLWAGRFEEPAAWRERQRP